jgi:hypothetical protein
MDEVRDAIDRSATRLQAAGYLPAGDVGNDEE